MKINKFLIFSLILSLFLTVSCDDNIDLNYSEPENVFVLNEPSVSNIFLNIDYPDNPAFTITWEDDVTGASSYDIEMATDLEFTSPITVGTVSEKQFTMTVDKFNQIVTALGASSYANTSIMVRVLGNGTYSNAILFNVNSYPEENPIITSPADSFSLVLSIDTPDDIAISVDWEDPSLGDLSTVSVNYTLQVALAGNNFADFRVLNQASEPTIDVTHDELNQTLLTLSIETEVPTEVELRLLSTITTASGDVIRYSDSVTIIVTAYPNYPDLFLVGNATAAGWDPNHNYDYMFKDPNQQGHYVFTGYFNEGMVKLLETKGQWQPQWGKGSADGILAGNPATQTNDPDVITVPANGYYTLDVDMAALTYSLTPYDASLAPTYPTIGILGHATPTGWGSHTSMTQSPFNPHMWYLDSIHLIQDDGGDCGDCGFKFRVDNTWNPNWGGDVNPPTLNYGLAVIDGKNIGVPEEGDYMVRFNDLDGRYMYILIP